VQKNGWTDVNDYTPYDIVLAQGLVFWGSRQLHAH